MLLKILKGILKMGTFNFNGKVFNGTSMHVVGRNMYINGEKVDVDLSLGSPLEIVLTGDIENVSTDGDLIVHGNVGQNVNVGGDARVDGDAGKINAGGDVRVGGKAGQISAGGDVRTG